MRGVKDANNVIAKTEYNDPYDRPTRVISGYGLTGPETATVEFTYPTAGSNTTTVSKQLDDTRWLAYRNTYDGFGRPILGEASESGLHALFGNFSIFSKAVYDGLGRVKFATNPYRATESSTDGWTRTAYDLAGRVIEVATFAGLPSALPPDYPATSGAGVTWTGSAVTTYSGEQTTVRDQANKQRRSAVDGLGRLIKVDEMFEAPSTAVYATTTYGYDARGNLKTVIQGAGQQTRNLSYDGLSRLVSAFNPESGTVNYQYDVASNLTQKTDAREPAVVTTYGYDSLNRVRTRTYSDGTPAVTYNYDTATNGVGRLASVVTAGVSTYTYAGYDALGRPVSYSQQTAGQTFAMGSSYNKAGLTTSESYPSNKVVRTEYDGAGRIAGVKDPAKPNYYAGASATDGANRLQYSAHGGVVSARLGNGKWEHTTFNSRLQPLQIGLGTTASDSSIMRLDYGYGTTNNNGNVLSQAITIGATVMSQSYGYDALNRLSSATETGAWTQTYDYDVYGNRAVRTGSHIPQPQLTPQSAFAGDLSAFNASNNRIQLEGFGYDGAGNLTGDPTTGPNGIAYDGENKQTRYTKAGATTVYSYDGDGHRVKKFEVNANATTVFVYNAGGQLIAEYRTDPVPPPSGGGGTSYLTSDHLGSTRVVTKQDGTVKARYDYLPFGEELAAGVGKRTIAIGYGGNDATRQKFTSYERDDESGLEYAQARYYSAIQGRFTSTDALFASARSIEPQSWNRYSYTINNPLNYTDSTGLDWYYDTSAGPFAQPVWWDQDPRGTWKRWTGVAGYVYRPVNAGGLWIALNPNGPDAFLTDTQENAEAKLQEWAGPGLIDISMTPAERDWLAGFSDGTSPLPFLAQWMYELQGVDTTSREYQAGLNTGALAGAMLSGAAAGTRLVTASSKGVALAEKALKRGATAVEVETAEEAAEVFLHTYQGGRGPGYRNTTGMTGNQVRNDRFLFPNGKAGTYHWDLADTQHGGVPHLQVHRPDGRAVRIFFKAGR